MKNVSQHLGSVTSPCGLILFPAVRVWSQVWSICFQNKGFQPDFIYGAAQFICFLVGQWSAYSEKVA